MTRLCAVGDSFVNGEGDPEGLGWVGRAVADLRRAGRQITFYNLGVCGNTSEEIVVRMESEVTVRRYPDVETRLILSFGGNDCCLDDLSGERRVAPEASIRAAETLLAQATAIGPTLMVGPPPMADAALNDRVNDLDGRLADLAAGHGVPYLGVFAALAGDTVWTRDLAAGDGAHPGAQGYAALAGLVLAWEAWRTWFD